MPTSASQTLRLLSLLPVLAVPGAALADLTAAGLWEDWQGAATAQGVTLAAESVRETDGGLLLSGVTSTLLEGRAETASVTAIVPSITLTERDDGTVVVTLPDGKRIEIVQIGASPERAVLAVDTKGLTVTASGTRAETDYAWAAPVLSVSLAEFDPGALSAEADLSLTLTELSGRLTGYDGALDGPVTGVFEAAQTDWSVTFADQTSGASMATEALQRDVVIQAESTATDPDGPQTDTARMRFAFDSGSGTSSSSQTAQGATKVSTTSHAKASIRMDFGPETALYTAGAEGVSVMVDDPAMPLRPITLTVGEVDLAFAGPAAEGPVPQPFDLTIELQNLTVDDGFWTGLDPAGVLPRDPMVLSADIDGLALFGTAAEIPGMPPEAAPSFAPSEATVNRLFLGYGDTTAEATGAFTFPSPAEIAEGMGLSQPQPVGALDVTMTGILELLGKLGQAGVVPPQQMMGAQMMLGMFAVPQSDGTLTSRIETTADGGLLVNGNRLR